MNFCKLNAVPFGVATIYRQSLPWQLIVADNYLDLNDIDGKYSAVKCWDSNILFDLDMEYLSDNSTSITSLSTGLFRLRNQETENIIVGVLFTKRIQDSNSFKTSVNFYENELLGTEKDPSNRIGELINFLTLPDEAIPYRFKNSPERILTYSSCYQIRVMGSSNFARSSSASLTARIWTDGFPNLR